MPSSIQFILTIAIIIVVFLLFVGFFLSRLYRRASKENAIVRTGWGGERIATTGGLLVFPVLHQFVKVKMSTLKLNISRDDKDALITKDRLRVDVSADFYLRVKKESEAVANAAQTLGNLTHDKDKLKALMEGKFVDALRAVAAVMTMDELHEKRTEFVQQVQDAVSDELNKNGLELETVSLVGLDQTDMEHFNPNNAFDAEGLRKLAEITESRRKERNDIEKSNEVSIARKNKDTIKEKLQIDQEREIAEAEQQKTIEVDKAKRVAEAKKEIEEQRQLTRTAEIEANRAIEEAEIKKSQIIEAAQIEKSKEIEKAEIDKKKALDLANQEKEIEIAVKSEELSAAEAKANEEKAKAIEAGEKVITAKETEIANREKNIAVIEAYKKAEQESVGITVKAEADKQATILRAAAIKIEAEANANSVIVQADADQKKYEVDAEGKRALNEAKNVMSKEIIDMTLRAEIIRNAAEIIKAATEPMKAIEGIKITHLGGLEGVLNNTSTGNGGGGSGSSGNLAEDVMNAMLKYRTMSPLVDGLLKEAGVDISNVKGIANLAKEVTSSGNVEDESSDIEDLLETE